MDLKDKRISDARDNAAWRSFLGKVRSHTAEARGKFPFLHWERDGLSRCHAMTVTLEEIGKLARCINKLAIAQDPDVRRQWLEEGEHRLITSASMLYRIFANWEILPEFDGKPKILAALAVDQEEDS